ncbi:MAG: pyruvate, phosphate dikinase, partial [Candidatus Levybacteria bacterium]|nr:pyruvate, phosphate dikinase [Candidatus Levybacteria bacterium]
TEHMFFDRERVDVAKEMIMTAQEKDSRFFSALSKLLDMQRADFKGILEVMDGKPVTIRLLDAPLHEFVPDVPSMEEINPMLGLRGCRFGILYPEVYRMQMRGIFEASCMLKQAGLDPKPEVMIPLVGNVEEIRNLKGMLQQEAQQVMDERGVSVDYTLGTMIELPAAALDAAAIAQEADFFSYGTNDLTQTTLGISRDDSGRFLPEYVEKGILQQDPFQTIDPRVQRLVEIATREGRTGRPGLKVGICGEHGGDPRSIKFFDEIGLDYVSMSPYRVPVARLAAARSQLAEDSSTK